MRPALHVLNKKLDQAGFKKVITSYYFSSLYYASDVWFNVSEVKNQKKISSTHHYAIRLLSLDFKPNISQKEPTFFSLKL